MFRKKERRRKGKRVKGRRERECECNQNLQVFLLVRRSSLALLLLDLQNASREAKCIKPQCSWTFFVFNSPELHPVTSVRKPVSQKEKQASRQDNFSVDRPGLAGTLLAGETLLINKDGIVLTDSLLSFSLPQFLFLDRTTTLQYSSLA